MSPRRAAPLTLEFVLLGLLAESPAHGYELHQKLRKLQPLALVWNVGQAQLYALLDKLAGQGLLSGEVFPGEHRPDRMRYSLLRPGKAASPVGCPNPCRTRATCARSSLPSCILPADRVVGRT